MHRPEAPLNTPEDNRRSEDGGTVLEPIEPLYAQYVPPPVQYPPPPVQYSSAHPYQDSFQPPRGTDFEPVPAAMPPLPATISEDLFEPAIRPAVPRLTILDDGELTTGETLRLRDQTTLIGRNDGLIRLPHDPLVSGRHAEIIREGAATPYRWVLRDLGSSNGTFVCCSGTVLRPDRLIILGSRRFRLQLPMALKAEIAAVDGTLMMDGRHLLQQAAPTLVETTNPDPGKRLEIPLSRPFLTLGRPGCGKDIELDDPLIAAFHAQIAQSSAGEWRIEAKPSKNGVWVQVSSIRLSGTCRFQCGEQRFLFVI
jgi:pSer/pThr/pTyr-binding forkhead associated (FHA) protein